MAGRTSTNPAEAAVFGAGFHGGLRLVALFLGLILFLGLALPAPGQERGADGLPRTELHETLLSAGRSFALVIGIDAYSGAWPRLSNAVKDARVVAEELGRHGFEVTLATDLDSRNLEAAVKDFIFDRGQDPDSRLLIWYAGHGHTVGDEAYLVPADAPGAERDAQFRRKALSMRDFGKFMREARARHVLAVFDSCFSGGVFVSTRSAAPSAVTNATSFPVRQMISSGQADQAVSDDGTFRRLFVDALRGEEPHADANQDGYVTGTELGLFLSQKLTSLTRNRQTPHFGKLPEYGLDRGDFVFRVQPGGSEGDAVATLPRPVAPALPEPTAAAPDQPAGAEPSLREMNLAGGETVVLRDGRLVFTMIGTPFGARSNLVGVYVNGKRSPLSVGDVVAIEAAETSCRYTLAEILKGENRAKFLEQCGAPPLRSGGKAALSLELSAKPAVLDRFDMIGGKSRVLEPGPVVFTMLGTPFGARRDLVGVTLDGERLSMSVGQQWETPDGACVLTAAAIRYKKNQADFLWRCR